MPANASARVSRFSTTSSVAAANIKHLGGHQKYPLPPSSPDIANRSPASHCEAQGVAGQRSGPRCEDKQGNTHHVGHGRNRILPWKASLLVGPQQLSWMSEIMSSCCAVPARPRNALGGGIASTTIMKKSSHARQFAMVATSRRPSSSPSEPLCAMEGAACRKRVLSKKLNAAKVVKRRPSY